MSKTERFFAVFDRHGKVVRETLSLTSGASHGKAVGKFFSIGDVTWEKLVDRGFTCHEVKIITLEYLKNLKSEIESLKAENQRLKTRFPDSLPPEFDNTGTATRCGPKKEQY